MVFNICTIENIKNINNLNGALTHNKYIKIKIKK